jgi:mannose-6-phosphate isomerase-like protein (cupin superfamily)
MRLTFLATVFAVAAFAQQGGSSGAAAMKTYASSADVQAMIAKAKAERKDQPLIAQPILRLAPYNASLEYRAAVGPAAVHEKEAELFYVIEGGGTLVTGGNLVNEKRANAGNLNGTAIEGGMTQKISKGDFAIVPENTPHWFSQIDGVLVLMSLHVPRTGN